MVSVVSRAGPESGPLPMRARGPAYVRLEEDDDHQDQGGEEGVDDPVYGEKIEPAAHHQDQEYDSQSQKHVGGAGAPHQKDDLVDHKGDQGDVGHDPASASGRRGPVSRSCRYLKAIARQGSGLCAPVRIFRPYAAITASLTKRASFTGATSCTRTTCPRPRPPRSHGPPPCPTASQAGGRPVRWPMKDLRLAPRSTG